MRKPPRRRINTGVADINEKVPLIKLRKMVTACMVCADVGSIPGALG